MHKANATVITCIDFRVQTAIIRWLHEKGYNGEYDCISMAGCLRDFVKPADPTHKENFLRQLDLSIKLHEPNEILIFEHQDCGGYGIDGTISKGLNEEQDLFEHLAFAKRAVSDLQLLYPDKLIKVYYVTLSGVVLDMLNE